MGHTRTKFDEQLDLLNESLVAMGKAVETAIDDATKAVVTKDEELAKMVMTSDEVIDEMEKDIEKLCLKIIVRQSPVASDLRFVSAVLKMITDLERIGDHAVDISEIASYIAKQEYIKELHHIPKMAEVSMDMLTKSIKSFVRKDVDIAKKVIAMDDEVDNLYNVIREELIELIKEDVNSTDQALDFLSIAKYYERVGDHATNIAEWVEFAITGVHKDSKVM